jgi:hypothetical protein
MINFQVLPNPNPNPANLDPKKANMLEDFDETELNLNPEGGKMKDDEDDEQRGGGGQRVQCAQQ